jgi:hypothetical protein
MDNFNKSAIARQKIIEVLRGVGKEGVTKWQLRQSTGLRKIDCFKELFVMVNNYAAIRHGTGRKRDPFKYVLAEFHLGQAAAEDIKPKSRLLMTMAG